MTGEEFDKIVNFRIEKIKEVLSIKAKEYRRNDNAFHNFEVGAQMENKHPVEILHGMHLKHLISYKDMIEDVKKGLVPTEEYINEKFGDIINYFILQEAQIKSLIKK